MNQTKLQVYAAAAAAVTFAQHYANQFAACYPAILIHPERAGVPMALRPAVTGRQGLCRLRLSRHNATSNGTEWRVSA